MSATVRPEWRVYRPPHPGRRGWPVGELCGYCDRPLRQGSGCKVVYYGFTVDGEAHWLELPRHEGPDPCGCCRVAAGGIHHVGCHHVPCPVCGDPFTSCGCPLDCDAPDSKEAPFPCP